MKVIYKMISYYTPGTQPLFYCIVPIICILCNKMDRMAAVECRVSPRRDCFILPPPPWNFPLTVALLNVPSP